MVLKYNLIGNSERWPFIYSEIKKSTEHIGICFEKVLEQVLEWKLTTEVKLGLYSFDNLH